MHEIRRPVHGGAALREHRQPLGRRQGRESRRSAYVVSKDAIRTFTRFVAEEEREWNVCVVAFSPKQAIATEDAPEEARKRLPGPECLGNGFVLAAQAGMELTGKTVEHREGKLVVVD